MSQRLIILSHYGTIYIITTAPIFLFFSFHEFVTMKCPLWDISALTTSCALICRHVHRPPAARFTKRLFSCSHLCCFVQHLPSKRRAAAGLTSKMPPGEVPRVVMKCECDSAAVVRIRFILVCEPLRNPSFVGFVVLRCTWVRCRVCKCSMRPCLFAAAEFAIIQVQVWEDMFLWQKWRRFAKESNKRHPWSLTSG